MYYLLFVAILVLTRLGPSNAIEIVLGTTIDKALFPIQYPNPMDPRSFYRRLPDNTVEKIVCPLGTSYDNDKNICVGGTKNYWDPKMIIDNEFTYTGFNVLCKKEKGVNPYPENCRKFVACWDNFSVLLDCSSYLLFSDKQEQCEYPLKANCCEYKAEDSSQIVD